MAYKKSIYSYVYYNSEKNVYCIYNSLTMEVLYCDERFIKIFNEPTNIFRDYNKLEKRFVSKLLEHDLWVENDFYEEYLSYQFADVLGGNVNIRTMVLHMTDYCNLRCKYCFIENQIGSEYIRKTMNLETGKAAIDKFLTITKDNTYDRKNRTIIFYGGEPLLNWLVLEKLLAYIKEKSVFIKNPIDMVIITNGTLIDTKIAKTLKQYNVEVYISLDGTKEVNDKNRVDLHGMGSFDKVIKSIKVLRDHCIEPALSSIMSKDSLSKIPEIANFLFGELKIKGLGFNHVSMIPDSGDYSQYDADYETQYAKSLLHMQEIIQREYPDVYEKRMGLKIQAFLKKEILKSTCTATGSQISVSTDGFIGVCQGYMGTRETFNNTVFDETYDPKNDEVFQEWATRTPYVMEECIHCEALSICGGGCPRNAQMISGSIWGLDKGFCHFSKLSLEWMIWQNYCSDEACKEFIHVPDCT